MIGVEIIGLGHSAPEHAIANAEIERRLGVEDGWIKRRTGIESRRYAAKDQALSDLAIRAGEMALLNSGKSRDDVALLLLATSTPDHLLPPTSPLVAYKLGLNSAGGIDLAGACAGFIYALTLGDAVVRSHRKTVLVVAANILSRRINPEDRASSVLFADAAGAVLLAPTERPDAGICGVELAANGGHYDLISIPGGGSRKPFGDVTDPAETLMVMTDGQSIYAEAVGMMTRAAEAALHRAGRAASDVTHFVPHQANARMMTTLAHRLGVRDDALCSTIADFGNSSAATIPFTLSMCAHERQYRRGDTVLMTAAGAGMTGGAVVFEW